MENIEEKLSCDFWFSPTEMKVTLKQLPEAVLKISYPWNSISLKKDMLPNSTMAFVDILRNN